ncbi:MAG TPA: alpha/beta fold hydrolase [Alphaproteobacteria bacterium]|nr:alpha/beta fold hydrolase [Alphaproteobacteria bacterium]
MNPAAAAHLQKLRAVQKLANTEFEDALAREAISRTRRFIKGVREYQHHPDRRDVVEAPVIWQAGNTLLRDYNPSQPDAPVVLVIPSLINRFDILDLDFAPSFLRSLAGQGVRPLVVDWDVPGPQEMKFDISAYVTERLTPIMRFIRGRKDQPIHVLGYCMGGLFALALAALRPNEIKSLTLMATPWDFHKPDASMGEAFAALGDQMEPCLQATGLLPVDIIESLFATMQPMQALKKFTAFAGMNKDSMEARQFVLLEDWLNDGVPLTAPVARECLKGWYGANHTAKYEWHVDGVIINPRHITIPSYVVVPGKDKIVPPESAMPLAKLLPHATLHEPMTGHIGMMASRNALRRVWMPYFHWLEQHK